MDRNDFGVSKLLNPHRVDWVDRERSATGQIPTDRDRQILAERRVRRRCDLEFTDGEGDHILCCVEAGDDE